MEHIYRPGKDNAPTLILLHGTGGDETDLIPLGTALNPNYNLLSIRGEVNENGMNRYFKRLAEGVYDEEDLEYIEVNGCLVLFMKRLNSINLI